MSWSYGWYYTSITRPNPERGFYSVFRPYGDIKSVNIPKGKGLVKNSKCSCFYRNTFYLIE
jgi:hypothetical protein